MILQPQESPHRLAMSSSSVRAGTGSSSVTTARATAHEREHRNWVVREDSELHINLYNRRMLKASGDTWSVTHMRMYVDGERALR